LVVVGGVEFSRSSLGEAMRGFPISGEQRPLRTTQKLALRAVRRN
jgi:hypothetical protein